MGWLGTGRLKDWEIGRHQRLCLSYRLCPIRPCGAPSPRGEGCDTRVASSKVAAKPPQELWALKAGIGVTELLPAEQPLREGARQRRRMDPRGGLKTNVKLSIPHACHSERSEKTLSFAVRNLRFSHMCRAPLRFPHLSCIPSLSYSPLCKGKADDTRVQSSKKSA